MHAQPKVNFDGQLRIIPGAGEGDLWIECEIVRPPSLAGKSVDVYISDELVTKLLLEVRESAIRMRSRGEEAG